MNCRACGHDIAKHYDRRNQHSSVCWETVELPPPNHPAMMLDYCDCHVWTALVKLRGTPKRSDRVLTLGTDAPK